MIQIQIQIHGIQLGISVALYTMMPESCSYSTLKVAQFQRDNHESENVLTLSPVCLTREETAQSPSTNSQRTVFGTHSECCSKCRLS